jgi:hypothetical protein
VPLALLALIAALPTGIQVVANLQQISKSGPITRS